MSTIRIKCRDPIQSRNGRPFGNPYGDRADPPGWPLPSIVVGSLRGAIAEAAGHAFTDEVQKALLDIAFAGPFPAIDQELYLPAPADCIGEAVSDQENSPDRIHAATPQSMPNGAGCDWPDEALLRPVMIPSSDNFKPGHVPAWWPLERMEAWLTSQKLDRFDETFLEAPKIRVDDRTPIVPESGLASESFLFSMATLSLSHLKRYWKAGSKGNRTLPDPQPITLSGRIEAEGWTADAAEKFDLLHPLGGKSRLVRWVSDQKPPSWECPSTIANALRGASEIRMVLATPAIFQGGWKPGWLRLEGDALVGTPPGTNVRLRLVGTCTRRWGAVAGWSLAHPRGPKPVKRMVPAGGVYFFKWDGDDDPAALAKLWLRPVSDDEQDSRDGFGLALWGNWDEQTTGGSKQ